MAASSIGDWGAPLVSSTTIPLLPMSMVNRLSLSVGMDSATGAGLCVGLGALSFFLKNGSATEYAGIGRRLNA